MNKNLILCAVVVLIGIFSGCNRSEPYSAVTPNIQQNVNTNAANVASTDESGTNADLAYADTPGVTDWVEMYDVDTLGYPYYPVGHENHRTGSVRCYPYGHPLYRMEVMNRCYENIQSDEDSRKKRRKIRYSKKNPTIFQATSANDSTRTASSNTPGSTDSSLTSNNSITNKKTGTLNSTKSTASTTYPSSTPYKSSSYPSAGSTPYKSPSYPSTSSTPYKSSSYPSTSSTPYKSSSSSSSTPSRTTSTTRRKP